MTVILDLVPEVAEVVRRCPNPVLVRAYRNAAREFCVQSRWLRKTTTLESIDASTDTYGLTLIEAGNDVVGIVDDMRGFEIGDKQKNWRLRPMDMRGMPVVSSGRPVRYAYVPEGIVRFFPPPDRDYGIDARVCVMPSIDATGIDPSLVTKWKEVLEQGALSKVYAIGRQAWSNPLLAEAARKRFMAGIANAKGDEQRGYNTGPVRAHVRNIGFR